MKYRMIDRCREAFSISMMCRLLDVSSSGFYDWRERPVSTTAAENKKLLGKIKALHAESDGVMGRRAFETNCITRAIVMARTGSPG